MTTRLGERRKNYFIKKEFQRNFILKFCGLVILASLISGAIIYAVSRSTVTTTFENSRLSIRSTADYILPTLLLTSIVVVALIGVATIVVTLFTSHRIAGPLYRIEKDVEEIAAGNLTMRFRLRTGDEIKALAVSLDVMAHNLREHIATIKQSSDALAAALERGAGRDEVAGILARLRADIGKFRT